MSKDRKVQATKNYRMFQRSTDNRVTNLPKHRKLANSMKQYGFLPCFPIVCYRDANKQLIVKDGQHRLAIAETLGLTVHWIEETIDFDVAIVNSTAKVWATRDYAEKYSSNGIRSYTDGLEFTDKHGIPVGIAFALLAGVTNYSNIEEAYKDGTFKIKDRPWADAVAGVYSAITTLSPDTRNAAFLTACMAICRVPDFEPKRLLHSASRCRDKLVSYSTRDAYLDMLEEVYNFGRAKLVGLKSAAVMAMRDRNFAHASKAKSRALEAASA